MWCSFCFIFGALIAVNRAKPHWHNYEIIMRYDIDMLLLNVIASDY